MNGERETGQQAGALRASNQGRRKGRTLVRMVEDRRAQSSLNRCQGQLNSPYLKGGNKLGSKQRKAKERKKATAPKGISVNPKQRKRSPIAEDDIMPQTENVASYLAHIRSVPANTYSQLLNACWGDHRISEEGYRILETLPKTPTYSLRFVNRIFCYDSWQNIPREDRPFVFEGCFEADFTSLHFQIFMTIIRKYLPEDAGELQAMMGDHTIWQWWELQGVSKADAKTPVQMLINCKSARQTKLMIVEPERQELKGAPPDGWIATRFNQLSNEAENWIKKVSIARNKLSTMIQERKILDAFGNPLPHLNSFDFFQLKGEWRPFWRLVRTDLNTLYSSYELKLLTDSIGPTIRGYERFKVVLHLHDGFFFQIDKKYRNQVFEKLRKDSDKSLKEMDIRSHLNLPNIDQVIPT